MSSDASPRREGETEADAVIAERLRSLAPPAGLKERILAQRALPAEVPVPRFRAPRRIYTLAALGVILVLASAGFINMLTPTPSFTSYEHALAGQIVSGQATQLAFTSTETAALKAWLAAHGALSAIDVPAGAARMPSIGCRTFAWNGRPVSQICFTMEDGRVAHLFVIGMARWRGAPPEGHPQFHSHGGWTMASWREAGATYILAREGDRAGVEKLFL